MANVPNGIETLPKISIAWEGRTNVTDRQTTDGRTTTYSERERNIMVYLILQQTLDWHTKYIHSYSFIHSFIHWTTWPAMGRCALYTTRSLAVSMRHQRRVLCRLPVVASTDGEAGHAWTFPLRPVVGAVTRSCLNSQMQCHVGRSDFWKSSYTWTNIARRRLVILSRTLSWPVRFMTVALVTKSYQRTPSIRRWHDILNASSFCSSDFSSVHVSAPCRRTETTKALYSRNFVDRHNFSCLQIFASWPIMLYIHCRA